MVYVDIANVVQNGSPYAIGFGPLSVLSCLSVCKVGALWPNGCMDQDETTGMDRGLGPDHIVLDGEPATLSEKNGHSPCRVLRDR